MKFNMEKHRTLWKILVCVSIIFNFEFSFFNSAAAQVPLRFKLSYYFYEHVSRETTMLVALINPDGQADTLSRVPLRRIGKSIRRSSTENPSRHYDRQLTAVGKYRLMLTVDTCTLELPFTLDGSELRVDAELYVHCYDSSYTVDPAVNIYRPSSSDVKLYYLGADTAKREILFNLVNRSSKTLYDGSDWNTFPMDLREYIDGHPVDFEHYKFYSPGDRGAVSPGHSRRLNVSPKGPGRYRATVCYTTDPYAQRHNWDCGGCIVYTTPNHDSSVYWCHTRSNVWYVAHCDIFLTTLDL